MSVSTLPSLSSLGVRPASELASASGRAPDGGENVVPVLPEIAALLPAGGLVRGSTVAVRGSTSLLLAMLATATATGSWAAVVGMPELGLLAAAELGVALPRLAVVDDPDVEAADVLAALLDGMDLVAVGDGIPTSTGGSRKSGESLARRLSARARHRGCVLLPRSRWPGSDLDVTCREASWAELGTGHGYLREQRLSLSVSGRGAAAREARGELSLPRRAEAGTDRDGTVEPGTAPTLRVAG